MAKNCDDHSKNFAFRLKKNERWELSPAYDICHAFRSDSAWVSQHALSINGKRKDILKSDLESVAIQMSIKKPKDIIDQINAIVKKWPEYAEEEKVNPKQRDKINATLNVY